MRGRWEPVGRIALYSVFEINFSLFSCSNRRCICVSILAMLSFAGGWSKIKEFGSVIQNCHHLVVVLVLVEDNDTRSFVGFCYDDVFIHPERLGSLKTFFCR